VHGILHGEYRCFLNVVGGSGATYHVGARAISPIVVDSPEAFDAAALTALSYASSDGWPVDAHASADESGWLVSRSAKKAFGV
jgi:hypothetical protein